MTYDWAFSATENVLISVKFHRLEKKGRDKSVDGRERGKEEVEFLLGGGDFESRRILEFLSL